MKRVYTSLVTIAMIFMVVSFLIMSCTKEGPQGPAGKDGEDGKDANATCTQCHNFSDTLVAKIVQYNHSLHGTGMNFERNDTNCAPCHTSQGFREVLETGENETSEAVSNPAPVNCRTCHMIHEIYTSEDWGIRTTDPIKLLINDKVVELAGSANLCGRCHQSRKPDPYPDLETKEDITINSAYWGPHYGSMAPVIASTGAIEIPGSLSYDVTSPHINIPCYTCHGGEPYGAQAGGHTFYMSYEYHGQDRGNTAVCEGCHSGIVQYSFDLNGVQTEIEGLIEQLENQLIADGLIDETLHIIPGTYSNEQVAIVMNYLLIHYDRSLGVHNYPYTKAVLQNSYEALNSR